MLFWHCLPLLEDVACQNLLFLMVPASLIVSNGRQNSFKTSPLGHVSEKIPQILGFFFFSCCCCVTSTSTPMGDKFQLFMNFKGRIHFKMDKTMRKGPRMGPSRCPWLMHQAFPLNDDNNNRPTFYLEAHETSMKPRG